MTKLLGDTPILKPHFPPVDFEELRRLPQRKRPDAVNRLLLTLIQKAEEPCFLLAPVLGFIDQVCRENVLDHYKFKHFELWLNQFSGLSFEENYRVRAKIAGKLVDRSDYQVFFPVGGGKVFEGTHFVTAHRSPDLDTTVASFWGWIDAFAARVGDGLHLWNVPGGPPAQAEIDWLFRDIFGPAVFTRHAWSKTTLNVSGDDLMTQKGLLSKGPADSIGGIDHEQDANAVVVVDEEGFYLGDWRSIDVEGVRDVILLLSSCLRWFENKLHLHWMEIFRAESLRKEEVLPALETLFQLKIGASEPGREFTAKQKQKVQKFLARVLEISSGLDCTFEELGSRLARIANIPFQTGAEFLAAMQSAGLFDAKGHLTEGRPRLFSFLEKAVRALHEAIFQIRGRLETLDIALKTKEEVFGTRPVFVTTHADVEEIRRLIGPYHFLTVNQSDGDRWVPLGTIHAALLRKNILGTVSLRDFCNRDEMGIPSYLEVISVIDHHKTTLATSSPPFAIIADAQSCNTLIAKQSFLLNDRYSLLGQTPERIEAQLEEHLSSSAPASTRLAQNLLQRRMIANKKQKYYIHPGREYVEYLHFLYAIIDDTDLLSKVTTVDVECVAELLNRMKSIATGRMTEIVSLDDLPRNRSFPKKAAQRILQNEDMHSLYGKIYHLKEAEIEKNLRLAAEGKPSNLFADTKEQNGICRVGQTKIFSSNLSTFEKSASAIRRHWLAAAEKARREKPDLALHLHMISTVVNADEVYRGGEIRHTHRDEMWIWIPGEEAASEILKRFLAAFAASPGLKNNPLEVEFFGEREDSLAHIFREANPAIVQKGHRKEAGAGFAVLRFNAGSLNSRKAMVTPFLPT